MVLYVLDCEPDQYINLYLALKKFKYEFKTVGG